MAAITLLKTARQSLKQWRSLPQDERERLRGDAERVRHLALELGGPAARRVLSDGDPPTPSPSGLQRDRAVVAGELKEAVTSLSRAVAGGTSSAAQESSRTLRYGKRAASFGYRKVRERRSD